MNKKPDTPEKIIRFVCGALFGFVLISGFFYFGISTFSLSLVAGVAGAIIFGILAVRYGDRFWERLAVWIPWF